MVKGKIEEVSSETSPVHEWSSDDPGSKEREVRAFFQNSAANLVELLEDAADGVLQITLDTKIVYTSARFENLLECASKDYLGHSFGEFFVNAGEFDEFWHRLLRQEQIHDFPADLQCNNGDIKRVVIHSHGLWVRDKLARAWCYIYDITEVGRMERELVDKGQRLLHAEAARDEFLAVAAHELKTPIAVLLGFTQLLLRDMRRKRGLTYEHLESSLGVIEQQSFKLKNLVSRLLETTQLGASKLPLELKRIDLAKLIRDAIATPRDEIAHTITYDGPESLEVMIDPSRMGHVIMNLVDNSIKFSPDGGNISIRLTSNIDSQLSLTVTDDGMGIPVDQREDVFNRYYQAHGEPYLAGMGLGLYLTREIVELHGGSIHIEQPDHPGTRVRITLPRSIRYSSD